QTAPLPCESAGTAATPAGAAGGKPSVLRLLVRRLRTVSRQAALRSRVGWIGRQFLIGAAPAFVAVSAVRNTAALEYRLFGSERPVDLARKLLHPLRATQNQPSYLQFQQGFASRRQEESSRPAHHPKVRALNQRCRLHHLRRTFFFEQSTE